MRGRTGRLWRPGSGPAKALLRAGWPRIGGDYKMQSTAGAVRRRNVPSRRTRFPAESMGGRAAWPTVRLLAVQRSGAGPRCVATPATTSRGLSKIKDRGILGTERGSGLIDPKGQPNVIMCTFFMVIVYCFPAVGLSWKRP